MTAIKTVFDTSAFLAILLPLIVLADRTDCNRPESICQALICGKCIRRNLAHGTYLQHLQVLLHHR